MSSILGKLVTVEVCERRPKHGVLESLHLNDVMSVVAGPEVREEPFIARTSKQETDFIHDGANCVCIRLRCQHCQCSHHSFAGSPSNVLVRAIKRKSLLLGHRERGSSNDDDNEDCEAAVAAALGRRFDFQGHVCKVKGIDLEGRNYVAIG